MRYRTRSNGDRRSWIFWCPGCEKVHQVSDDWVVTEHADGTLTVEPSILVTQPPTDYRCHSFLRAGVFEFLGDSSHDLAGKSAPMPDLPEWLTT